MVSLASNSFNLKSCVVVPSLRTHVLCSVAYSGWLGDWYTGLGAQSLTIKKHFSSFLFSVVFQQKICWSSDQWFHNASNYIEMA